MKVTISLNGTGENPYLKFGMSRNPFPAIPRAEYTHVNLALARLGSECLTGPDDIRRILEPVTAGPAGADLIALCCKMFRPGEFTQFDVTFPE